MGFYEHITVGYGDISQSTPDGRIPAILIMFFGIGLPGVLSASLASMLFSVRIKDIWG
ncbi:MAG: ion channel [Desulfopila sp.]